MMNVTRRSTVLGLPIGTEKRDWRKVAGLGAGAVAAAACLGAVLGLRRNGEAVTDDEVPRDDGLVGPGDGEPAPAGEGARGE